MSLSLQFKQVCGETNGAVLDIIFIHGITGDPTSTWINKSDEFWPAWLVQDLSGVCIYTAGYPSSLFAKWTKKEMDLHERASNLVEHLVSNGIGKRPLVFVCHSLGGLIAKEMFRACCEAQDEDWQALANQLKQVVFFATPHLGAPLAAVFKTCFSGISSSFLDTLSDESGYLSSLNVSFRDLAVKHDLSTVAYYEKYKTKNVALVVSRESADPGCTKTRPIPVDADHITICKPDTKDATVYLSLCRHLRNVHKECSVISDGDLIDTLGPDDYSIPSTEDRRTLQEKMIDAGREHDYAHANNLQSRFARKYHRLGLFTEAKNQHDSILSAVEQRFLTHIYGPKICKGASESEIAAALQEHVIDPLCASTEHGKLTNSTILQALYYLTEQCHIQWDANV